jgi:hypothetical protein
MDARASKAVSLAFLATLILAELSLVGATLPVRGGDERCLMSDEGASTDMSAPACGTDPTEITTPR